MRKIASPLVIFVLFVGVALAQGPSRVDSQLKSGTCPSDSGFCAELSHNASDLVGRYTGHDEPALLFYSGTSGAGNNVAYRVTLPADPPTPPKQAGTGGTFNFQMTPAFWFGMVLCDTQSSPNSTHTCNPDTDANIFDSADPNSLRFIGKHPGSAFLELQFYPPGGVNTCADPKLWCVAMAIFSFNVQDLSGKINNADCQKKVGLEPSNFAFLTFSGISQTAADPLNPATGTKFGVFPGETFQMNSGDSLNITLHDTATGLQAIVQDLSSGKTGSMKASIANGFAHVVFAPDPDPKHPSVVCSSSAYAFHPMYATSSEHTRSTWTAHTANISFSEEIGHFEYCAAVASEGGNCTKAGVNDAVLDKDDKQGGCFSGTFLASFGLQPIGQCISEDFDFDGPPYRALWPGTGAASTDAKLKPRTIKFNSPRFQPAAGGARRAFSRAAFETDLPQIEFSSNPRCNLLTGAGCTNPPHGARFYPIFSIAGATGKCNWQFGGAHIPGTSNAFGGNSTAEYGALLPVAFITPITPTQPKGGTVKIISDYRRILAVNPCP